MGRHLNFGKHLPLAILVSFFAYVCPRFPSLPFLLCPRFPLFYFFILILSAPTFCCRVYLMFLCTCFMLFAGLVWANALFGFVCLKPRLELKENNGWRGGGKMWKRRFVCSNFLFHFFFEGVTGKVANQAFWVSPDSSDWRHCPSRLRCCLFCAFASVISEYRLSEFPCVFWF